MFQCEKLREEYEDAMNRMEFERIEYESELENLHSELVNSGENVKVRAGD